MTGYKKHKTCGAGRGKVRRTDRKKWLLLLAVHAAVILFCVIFFLSGRQGRFYGAYRDPDSRYFSVYGVQSDDKTGYLVDETIGTAGLFTCGPYMELKKGIYEVTVYYECSGTGNQCAAYSEDGESYADALRSDMIELDANHTVKTFTIQNRRDCQDFEVQTYYGGNGTLLIKGITVSQGAADSLYTILKILCLTALADAALFLFYAKKKQLFSKESVLIGLILTGTICFVSSPLLRGGMFHYTTDLNFILMRIDGLKDGLLSGAFPVRIQPNWLNGYGYATSIFYGDLFLILPAVLRMFGVSVQGAYFVYLLCINTATCLIAYFCFKGMFRVRHIALLGSCVYTLSTVRLTLVYIWSRGGMYTAYTFLPLAAYGVWLIYTDSRNKKSWFYLSLAMTGLIQSHLLTAEITAFTLLLVILATARTFFRRDRVLAMCKAVGASVLLNIGFLTPLLGFMGEDLYVSAESWKAVYGYIQKKGEDASGFLTLFRDGNSVSSPDFLLLLGMFLFLVVLLLVPAQKMGGGYWKYRKMGKVSFAVSSVLLFMSTKYFCWDFIEQHIPASRMPVNSLQFPNRFYELTTVLMVITLCCGLLLVRKRMEKSDYRTMLTVIGLISLFSAGYMLAGVVNENPVTTVYDTAALDDSRISTKEYLPEGADPDRMIHETAIAGEGVGILSFDRNGLSIKLECINEGNQNGTIELPLVWYKGYRAADATGDTLPLSCGENKTVLLTLPPDYHGEIIVAFHEPAAWTAAFFISIVGAAALTWYFFAGARLLERTKKRDCDEKNTDTC